MVPKSVQKNRGNLKRFRLLPFVISRLAGSRWLSFGLLFLLAFWVRLRELNEIPARYLVPTAQWELGSIAISLMKTGQFANPYMIQTGPTAHLPPIYPFIFSLIYRWYGLTFEAGNASWLFIIAAGSLLYALLPWISDVLGLGRPAGFIGGLAGALLVEWPGHGEYLTGIVLGLMAVVFLRRWSADRLARSASFFIGLAAGITFHLQPAILPVVLAYMVFEWWWRKDPKKSVHLGLITLGAMLACIPWAWRNYTTLGGLIFVRSNFGLELRMGNHDLAAATMEVMDSQEEEHRHPRTHLAEVRLLREIGEVKYMRQARREALDWIRSNPVDFLWLTVQRFANVWAGPLHRPRAALGVSALTILAFAGGWRAFPALTLPQRAALLIPLAAYSIIYYFVAYMPRYRVPIDWVLFMLAGGAVKHLAALIWKKGLHWLSLVTYLKKKSEDPFR